jgi:hypothetical protein
MTSNREVFENVVATFVDIASIMVAYTIGIHQSSFFLGLAYGLFDAAIVVWMRKPLANAIGFAFRFRSRRAWESDVYVADL